ncbi:cytochrome b [Herbaspirillum rubrisubalbicans]|uniref:cytochrome b/b6 domain-containing protein n=1 Tax=Herbaspirillum rubrisubalbicans TaxID=80842 RepID=UPI00209FE76D|nr:cytochrome b/b6 domain-containing protein [Herbaspirillum rubrisubalbicans]MCP1575971.1 cytochrome b [Herbaspirillum rubrisubalbicans]
MSRSIICTIRVWDLPTRLSHWTLLFLLIFLFITAFTGRMKAHAVMGQAVLILVVFRFVWGFIGSQSARFADFVKGPSSILHYISTGKCRTLGHNPLGALMVLALLTTMLVQSLSGLFSNDGIGFNGPFSHLISGVASDSVTRLHVTLAYVIAVLVVVHILAVVIHWMLRGEDLILPMFSGNKKVQTEIPELRFAHTARALAIVVAIAFLLSLAKKLL